MASVPTQIKGFAAPMYLSGVAGSKVRGHQQMAVLQQSAISGTNMVEHPGMDNLPVHTNEIGFLIAVGRKQRIALGR